MRNNDKNANLKQRNRGRLHDWLNADYPNRIQGRIDPEAILESRKLEGNVLLKSAAMDRIDRHYNVKNDPDNASKSDHGEAKTDSRLLRLFFKELGEEKHPIYVSAARHVLLAENTAGGMIELERLRVLAQRARENGAPMIATEQVVKLCQEVIEWALDKLSEEGFRLEVAKDITNRSLREEQHEVRRYTRNDTYQMLYDKAKAIQRELGIGQTEAEERVAKAENVSTRTMRRARNYVERGEENCACEGQYA